MLSFDPQSTPVGGRMLGWMWMGSYRFGVIYLLVPHTF